MERDKDFQEGTAEYMVWKVTADEDGARERVQRTISWQDMKPELQKRQ